MKKNKLRTLVPGLAAALTVTAIALAGPLEPPRPPDGTPPDTMKSLNEVPASWHQLLPADVDGDLIDHDLPCDSQRFRCVMPRGDAGVAVLDLETGLVWERTPDVTVLRWESAAAACYGKDTGGRFGWRLPRVHELATLLDLGQTPHLATGHPFTVGDDLTVSFWTATERIEDTDFAYSVHFADTDGPDVGDKTLLKRVWCVRAAGG
jgi:hypothetical protein